MKRFIDIGDQTGNTDEGVREFAFFDTVRDQFEKFNGCQVWVSIEEFKTDYNAENFDEPDIERYINLIPSHWNKFEKIKNRIKAVAEAGSVSFIEISNNFISPFEKSIQKQKQLELLIHDLYILIGDQKQVDDYVEEMWENAFKQPASNYDYVINALTEYKRKNRGSRIKRLLNRG